MNCRSARIEDCEGIYRVYLEAFPTTAVMGFKPPCDKWSEMLNNEHIHYVVAERGDEIIGAASLIVIEKLLRGGSKIGLIEDVAVLKRASGEGVGKEMIRMLQDVSVEKGCYKTILNCPEEVKRFYEKSGFYQKEVQMRWDPLS